jgi:hypothetical protein
METIFLDASYISGFKKWSLAHKPANSNDDPAGGATPVVIDIQAADKETTIPSTQPDRPWLIQGIGNAL